MSARRTAGFTLLEILAVVMLTGIVIGFTTNFYLDLSAQSRAALEQTRTARRAVVLLDRVARDLQSAMLVRKPGPVDPIEHPWLFLAESDDPDRGAQRLKFTSRGHRPRSSDAPESDVAMVAWMLVRGEDDALELWRWSAPGLPPARDLSFPRLEESNRVAGGIAEFGVFLIGEDGQPVARWDSSALVQSSELPLAAEIRVSLYADDTGEAVVGPFVRRVTLPLPPLDLEAQLAAAGARTGLLDSDGDGIPDAEEDEDGDGIPDIEDDDVAGGGDTGADGQGKTVAACLDANPELRALLDALDPGMQAVAQSMMNRPVSEVAPLLTGIVQIPSGCL